MIAVGPAERWAWAEVDLDAIAHNVGVVRQVSAPAAVWAVVKADGYGHGALPVARTTIDAGCEGLCVALTSEGVALRKAGIYVPILLLSEQPPGHARTIVKHRLTPTVSTAEGIEALAAQRVRDLAVHLKIDTGMRRVGAAPSAAAGLAQLIGAHEPWLRLAGVFTHLAIADEPGDPYTEQQLARFDKVLDALPPVPITHAANSAGALAHPSARRSFVRAGIALYGISPGHGVDHLCRDLRPAMALKAKVSFVKRVRRRRPDLLRAASHVRHRVQRGDVADRVRRRRPPRVVRRRGRAHRRTAASDRRRRHDGPADGRLW